MISVYRRATGKGALNLRTVCLAFVPLQSISPDADKLQRSIFDVTKAGIDNKEYPSGLCKQYEIQLRHLQEQVPSLEIMLAPTPIAPVGRS